MTRDETRFLLGRLCAAYGRRPPAADVVDEWARALRRYTAAEAAQALDAMIDQGRPGPSLPAFVAAVRAQAPTLLSQPRSVPHPLPWDGPTLRGRELVAKARSMLRHPTSREDR